GKLAELTRAVASANVNITGIDIVPNGGQVSSVRLLVSDPTKMDTMLHQKGIQFQSFDVLSLRMPNRPGSIAEISERLAKAGVDIETLYGYSGHGTTPAETEFVLQVRDITQAEQILRA
ncbi:MAG TPA: ACT domain-containing protein, partial [Candidatus Thermoplasmatota archaeon]|nr:ACT domain-containing protein [Candidatus Thermoplasmatota archaeon]